MNIRRLDEVHYKQDITFISLSKFLNSLSHSCYNYVMSRDPKTGSEAAELATEFAQSQNRFRQCRYNYEHSSTQSGVPGQRAQPYPNRGFTEFYGHKRSQVGVESYAPNNAGNDSQGVQTSSNYQRSSAFTCKRNIVVLWLW